MASDSSLVHSELLARALACYIALMRPSTLDRSHSAADPGLGGSLFFLGDLNEHARAMIMAANVAGCASLVASSDPIAQKAAIRDGIVDFAVTSLDEALRILKNEVRKRARAAVCVGLPSAQVEREMMDRGVAPDLVAEASGETPLFGPARLVRPEEQNADQVLLSWSVAMAPTRFMPALDAIATGCLNAYPAMQRWIRLSPRFAGRTALSNRVIFCDNSQAEKIVQSFKRAIETGGVAADISMNLQRLGGSTPIVLSTIAAP